LRIGIIADIHGNLPGLEASWERLSHLDLDQVVCLGDLVQYGPYPAEVVDFVAGHDIETVQGNCDRAAGRGRTETGDVFVNVHWKAQAEESMEWTLEQLDSSQMRFLRKLPSELRYKVGRWDVLCVHGLPGNVNGSIGENDTNEVYSFTIHHNSCQVLALGHTHRMLLRSVREGMIMNPGSVGGGTLPGESTLAILEVEEETGTISASWMRVPFDTASYAGRFRQARLPETFLKCVILGRDPRGEWLTDDINRRQKWAEPL